jgi:hypothetical protein
MTPDLELLTHGGRCPTCGRDDVRSIAGVIRNCDATVRSLVTDRYDNPRGGLVLAGTTLRSTAADLRCALGACKNPLPP